MCPIVGCAAPVYNYRPVALEISEPPISSVNTIYVGDVLLKQGSYTEHDSIYLQKNQRVSWAYTILHSYYLKQGEDESTESYKPASTSDGGGIDKAAIADPWESVQAFKQVEILCTIFHVQVCEEASFSQTKETHIS